MKKIFLNLVVFTVLFSSAASAREEIVILPAPAHFTMRPAAISQNENINAADTPPQPSAIIRAAQNASEVVSSKPAPQVIPAAHVDEAADSSYPAELIIPSIDLDSPIQNVGINNKGEMDVPSGKTNNVGWYQYGTVPGSVGSAVFDAHVFAAFANLKHLVVGSNLYVVTEGGSNLHFVVSGAETYSLSDVPLNALFNRNDGSYLNLITCAGKLTPDHSTYDHRLIVHAKLVNE